MLAIILFPYDQNVMFPLPARWEQIAARPSPVFFLRCVDLEEALAFHQKALHRDLPRVNSPYGEAVGLGVDWLAFSLSLAAFAVACCRRSESDFNRSASGVLCGLTVVLSSGREQPAAARTLRARMTSRKFFIDWSWELRCRPDCYSAACISANLKKQERRPKRSSGAQVSLK